MTILSSPCWARGLFQCAWLANRVDRVRPSLGYGDRMTGLQPLNLERGHGSCRLLKRNGLWPASQPYELVLPGTIQAILASIGDPGSRLCTEYLVRV